MPLCPEILFDAGRVPTPCFVLDADRLRANAAVLAQVQERTGARILLALKGFAAWAAFPLLSRFKGEGPLWGACASSVDEARLAREEFGGEVHAFAAAWNAREMAELLELADHLVFNSTAQWRQFRPAVAMRNQSRCPDRQIQCGLRINPEHSEGAAAIYNPCAPGSRLGIRRKDFDPTALEGISGLHFHTLCEQNADALERTLAAVEEKFGPWLPQCRWINMGGGHHITRPDYDLDQLCRLLTAWRGRYQAQIYLEPGEAVALNAGWLTATVLDVVQADMPVAILDIGVPCHMPDVLEMPYRPSVLFLAGDGLPSRAGLPGEQAWTCRLAGKSCLAGDVAGEYAFSAPLRPGQRLAFEDMAIYSMVKTTTFNGLRLPSIGICEADPGGGERFRLLRQFGYQDFKGRLS
ncbi:carboxynorspermidine decarboxylase [Desulfovibrio legallii]|uniref:Carboxynorspermidine/carboxyspermidine decarboxylase n=1 Tax=Desulfovibrio legallii TaxID=571438 RepID=A0A1G7Q908_9BACT|nr:carboxynorspermidine decarboxylase [Desulfovibrio legallii]SDF94945.1 carboxynorspermidine decarboxylase [Desulfovibrio legallii]